MSPPGSSGYLDLILTETSGVVDTIRIEIFIGKKHYLVWDPDRNNSSGPVIHSILQNLGYDGNYTNSPFHSFEHLNNYKSLFVCTGVAYENYVLFNESYEVAEIVDFVNQGGNIYLEGGECWCFDPFVMYGFDFNPIFGIKPVNDGYTKIGPIEGIYNTFTDRMLFRYDGENFYLDQIDSTATGFRIFHDQDDDYYCGVANISSNYRTVGVSFELSGLVDNEQYTKTVLLDSIMHFFGIELVGIKEENKPAGKAVENTFQIYPNPFRKKVMIKYTIQDVGYMIQDTRCTIPDINLKIYDVCGRVVRDFSRLTVNGEQSTILWDGTDDSGRKLPSSVYFIRLENRDFRKTEKAILLR